MRLKAIKIVHKKDETVKVVPLYWAKGKGTMTRSILGVEAATLKEAMVLLVKSLIDRKDLTQ